MVILELREDFLGKKSYLGGFLVIFVFLGGTTQVMCGWNLILEVWCIDRFGSSDTMLCCVRSRKTTKVVYGWAIQELRNCPSID